MNTIWSMQLHPNDAGSFPPEKLIEILDKYKVVGIGEDNLDTSRFQDEAEIGDRILVRSGGLPVALVEICGPCVRNDKEDDLCWFPLVRNVKVLSSEPDFDGYRRVAGEEPDSGLKKRGTFQRTNCGFAKFWVSLVKDGEAVKKIKELVEKSLNVVFTGAPGTGKTYLARKIAHEVTKKKEGHVLNVQFHPSYGYADFIEGLRPVRKNGGDISFERKDGVFMEFCRDALVHAEDKYVVVIDEINRGDISKIFGELFSLIEVDYRTADGKVKGTSVSVKTQYNNLMDADDVFKDGFYIPPNVYIIGTMNDVDRSVESMDFAIRRRFVWHEVTPEERFDAMWGEDNVQGVERETVKARMRDLNEKIRNDQALGEAYQIGPAYFMKLKDLNGDYESLWSQSLRLLLKEYLRGMPDAQQKLEELHAVLVK